MGEKHPQNRQVPKKSAMDMVYSAPVHQDPLLAIDVIDEAWAQETLPVEDVEVPAAALVNIDEDDPNVPHEEDDDNKWNDLALDELSSAAPPRPAAENPQRQGPAQQHPTGQHAAS